VLETVGAGAAELVDGAAAGAQRPVHTGGRSSRNQPGVADEAVYRSRPRRLAARPGMLVA